MMKLTLWYLRFVESSRLKLVIPHIDAGSGAGIPSGDGMAGGRDAE
jgi:hypothetical protein